MPRKKLSYPEILQLTEIIHEYGINPYSREIYLGTNIHEEHNSELEIDWNLCSNFIKNLNILEQMGQAKITIHMSVGGGSQSPGIAIFDSIVNAKSTVNIIAYGEASSMSGIILQAADKRIMMNNSHLLIHHGSIGIESTSTAVSEAVKFNDQECNKMVDIFAKRAIVGPYFKEREYNVSKIKKFIKDTLHRKTDWYLDSSSSYDFGFCDQII